MVVKRRLKKSVRNSIVAMGIIFTGVLAVNIFDNEHVTAEASEKAVQQNDVASVGNELEKNSELASEYYSKGVDAFYVYDSGKYSVFIKNDTKEKVYVKKSVLKESFATRLDVGDNVKLYSENLDVVFIEVGKGKSIGMKALTLSDYNSDYTKIVFEDEQGNQYKFDKEFIESNGLNNGESVGSIATGYTFDGEIVAVNFGW